MALTNVSVKTVPITLGLALQHRDMESIRGERDLKATRARHQLELLKAGKLLTMMWGICLLHGKSFRGNGNHTSHLIALCLQATLGTIDERSQWFLEEILDLTVEDLPKLKDGELFAVIETCTAEDQQDLIDYFRRWDAKGSSRSATDILGVHAATYEELSDLQKEHVGKALAGVLRVAKVHPDDFGFSDRKAITHYSGDNAGHALNFEKVREAVRWIVETVPDIDLYEKVAGAQIMTEIWHEHGPEVGEKIVTCLAEQIQQEGSAADTWNTMMNKKRNKPTVESLVKKGRSVVSKIVTDLLETV